MTLAVESELRAVGAVFSGHTAFRNGRHGDGWIEKGFVVRRPELLERFTHAQAQQVRAVWPDVSLVVGASYCGAVVATFVARHLGTQVAFVNDDAGQMAFHRMHLPAAGQRALIVDDLIFSGNDVRAVAAFLEGRGDTVLGVSAWLSRAELPTHALLTLGNSVFQTYPGDDCPLCAQGVPVEYADIRE